MQPRRLGFFTGRHLSMAETFEGFCRAATMRDQPDLCFVHGIESTASAPAKGLVRGVTWFGPGKAVAEVVFVAAKARMANVESVNLRDAAFLPSRATVFGRGHGVYEPSAGPFALDARGSQALALADPSYVFGADGSLSVPGFDRFEYHDAIGIPVCGIGFPNYGHFLFDGLSLAWLLAEQLRRDGARLIGAPLGRWQEDVLRTLGLLDLYRPVTKPTRFRRLVTSNLMFGHVPYPTRFARLTFDLIRARVGVADRPRDRRIFIVRPDRPGRRHLLNAAEVVECMRGLGFDAVQPEQLSFKEQVRLFAAASVVVGESGAAMANIGFCDPGTRILEIMPEVHLEGWTRATSLIFSHEWHIYFASVVDPPPLHAEGEARMRFTYRIDIASLKEAIRSICGERETSERQPIESAPQADVRQEEESEDIDVAVQHAREGRHREAVEALAKFRQREISDVTTAHKIGVALKYCQRYEDALSYFNLALRILPSFQFSQIEIGSIHESLGQKEEALSWYLRAISSAPDYVPGYMFAARLEQQLGRNSRAVALLMRACEISPSNRAIQTMLAQFLVYQNARMDAIAVYERMISSGLAQDQDHISYLTLLNDTGAYEKIVAHCAAMNAAPASGLSDSVTRLLAHAKLARDLDRQAAISAAVAREADRRWKSPSAVSAEIRDAVRERRPFSMIRLGDGEARFLIYSCWKSGGSLNFDEAFATGDSIWRNWFGTSLARFDAEEVARLSAAFGWSISTANVLGIPTAERLRRDFAHFGYLVSLVKAVAKSEPDGATPSLTDASINIELHRISPFYREFLGGLEFLGVVSPHPDLARLLGRYLGINQVASYVIPGEMRLPERPGLVRGNGHFPDRYKQLITELAIPYAGAVFLVAGGLLGKIYCAHIKRLGGIAIDIGAVADAWTGYATRPGQFEPRREWALPGAQSSDA
jgi:tetratricopeptide (TPR) repeat protein